ncbi:sensor histidine kinase [Streptomyces indicus]|uniref:histidine kinase n=1 Tax=Streptomyces indicus TaxID=417292 RepID=A0A1G8WMR3_9ACTN|nr:sensor histidine kinase [Streptomyces indicus]SDJ79662.1 Signal transduction histidine kinase [Streptomyces indicus]
MPPTAADRDPHRAPVLRRIRPETWAVVLWGAAYAFALLDEFFLLPGEALMNGQAQPSFSPGLLGWALLAVAAGTAVAGSRLLRERPLIGYALFLTASAWAAATLGKAAQFDVVAFLAPAFALYCVALRQPRRTGAVAAGLALAVLLFPVAARRAMDANIDTAQLLAALLTVLVAWFVGDATHQTRAHAAALQEHAARQAVTAERLRIAREMHDTVAHSIGIIALQAGAAARIVHTRPERAGEAMRTVEETGRETLAGLRRMLGTLREDDAAPPQGLAGLDRLADATTAAGVRVAVTRQGPPRPLPQDVDLAAYRIVQEAVTNVVRHAGAQACEVLVEYGERDLTLEITDRGKGPGEEMVRDEAGGPDGVAGEGPDGVAGSPEGGTPGFGIAGMRERVALLDGEFSAGARAGGGFRVAARLPLPKAAA